MARDLPTAWAFVPARGGSKSIRLKNLVPLAGRPMLDYGVRAAAASGRFAQIVCSTDHSEIATRATELGILVDPRPEILAGDDARVDLVVQEYLQRQFDASATLPEVIVLVQPTSPFLRTSDIDALLEIFARDPNVRSAHNVTSVSHNDHAWNQRMVDNDGRVSFRFADERAKARQKQDKPSLMVFGNLIAARSTALLDGAGFYANPCGAVNIPAPYNTDVDGPLDLVIAEAVIASGAVVLPHMDDTSTKQQSN